jgi:hypothetical protein
MIELLPPGGSGALRRRVKKEGSPMSILKAFLSLFTSSQEVVEGTTFETFETKEGWITISYPSRLVVKQESE